MNTILWESEKEVIDLKKQLEVKNEIIKELQSEIYFSDLELEDMRQLVEKSFEVKLLTTLLTKVQELSTVIRDLEEKAKETRDLIKKSEDFTYLQSLNDRNDKLMQVNTHLMEQLYKGKVIYM